MNRLLAALPVFAALLSSSPSAAEAEAPACVGATAGLLPLEALAISQTEAREVEERLREAMARLPGVCLQPRDETLRALGLESHERVAQCADPLCRASLSSRLGAQGVFTGTARGLGGRPSVALVLWDERGVLQAQVTLAADAPDASLTQALTAMWRQVSRSDAGPAAHASRSRLPHLLYALAGGAAVTAAGFGFASRETASRLEGRTGCAGEGDAFAACFDALHARGRSEALWANVFAGAGVLVAGGATLLLVWETP